MDVKSMKKRVLLTLYALFKYTDSKHMLNSVKLNEILAPYELDCHRRVLYDTALRLQELGVDVRVQGAYTNYGVWLAERPLKDEVLNKLIFAICTNPLLSTEQADEILSDLKPLVTVYQEPALKRIAGAADSVGINPAIYETYAITHQAILEKRRVRYKVKTVRFDAKTGVISVISKYERLYTPKYLYRADDKIYMIGYDNALRKVCVVDLDDVVSARRPLTDAKLEVEKALNLVGDIDPASMVPGKAGTSLYKGPVTFRCRAQYINDLYKRFGLPNGPVKRNLQHFIIYPVEYAEITTETLSWVEQVPDGHGVRIVGPDELVCVVKKYYEYSKNVLLNPSISWIS